MSNLISRDEAIAKIEKAMCEDGFRSETGLVHKTTVYEILRSLPDAQPNKGYQDAKKEVIHCKDCKHYWTHRCMDSMPSENCDLGQTFYDADIDYCSLEERREK